MKTIVTATRVETGERALTQSTSTFALVTMDTRAPNVKLVRNEMTVSARLGIQALVWFTIAITKYYVEIPRVENEHDWN